GATHSAVQLPCETVRGDMDHPSMARYRLTDETLNSQPIGLVVLRDNLLADRRRRRAGRRGKEPGMTDRAIEVDEQTAHGRRHERRPESRRQLPRHCQRAAIVAAMGI